MPGVHRTHADVAADVRRSAKIGAWIGLGLLAFGVLRLAAGGVRAEPQMLWFLPVYVLGGAVAGCVVGFLKPMTTHIMGAMLVGFLILFPLVLATSTFVAATSSLPFRLKASAAIAAILGPLYALALWRSPTPKG